MTATAPAFAPAQTRVLDLLVEGHPNKVIAHRLGIAEGTVKSHVSAIARKTGAKNRVQIAVGHVRRVTGAREQT